MRLVCDKCSAVHTIEDRLVGARDFRASCKECGAPIVVRSAQQVPSDRPPAAHPSGFPPLATGLAASRSAAPPWTAKSLPPAPKSFAPAGGEAWFVSLGGVQQGPYTAAEFSRLLEQERLDWTTPVWRDGLKDWRPARRDAVLVTSVAGARGNGGDTMRLNSSRSFLAPEDTVVDIRPHILHTLTPHAELTSSVEDLLSSNSETQTIDARQLGIPQLTPSARPSAWSSAENASFRAGLGMPADSIKLPKSPGLLQPALSPTMADAFRSAPSLLRGGRSEESTPEADMLSRTIPSAPAEGWMPKPHSMLAVAAMAFAAGVTAAAAWGYWGTREPGASEAHAPRVPATATAATRRAPMATAPAKPATSPAAGPDATKTTAGPKLAGAAQMEPAPNLAAPAQASASATQPPVPSTVSTVSLRELPDPEELRAEVRHVAPDVKRCVDDTRQGVDVDIYLDGPSGRVRDVDVRSPPLAPGRVECISHAVRQMRLVPFVRHELKLMHKFSW